MNIFLAVVTTEVIGSWFQGIYFKTKVLKPAIKKAMFLARQTVADVNAIVDEISE